MSKKSDKKIGEFWIIKNFLDSLRDAQQRYNMAVADLKDCNDQQNDILHAIEIGNDDWTKSQLASKLRSVRIARRKAKNTIETLEKIVQWTQDNDDVFKSLERLQGQTKRIEEIASKRAYSTRTTILNPES